MANFQGTEEIDFTEDILDSRAVEARIEFLANDDELSPEEESELEALRELQSDGQTNISDWSYGETLVNEDYFEDYTRELASDISGWKDDGSWPGSYIDWEAAADALKEDYTELEVTYGGDKHIYWARG